MNTEQLKQAALNGDPDAASPEQVLALLECVELLRYVASDLEIGAHPHLHIDAIRAALQKLEAL